MTTATKQLPVVAIVGRPNVGKSALFNRIVGGRPALVEDIAGTTRDRIYGEATWRGRDFRIVDTGGLEPDVPGTYTPLVRAQVEQALHEAEIVLFVVDAISGTTAADLEVADLLRRTSKPVLLLANKAETREREAAAVGFYELGLGEPIAISAHHGHGVADVLDMIADSLPPAEQTETETGLRLAIVGRPNVGKSSLLNAVLGEERVIVSEVPGTTRDAIDTEFAFDGRPLVLVDTAGLRRRGAIEPGVEKHSTLRARRALERAEVALCVFDLSEGFTAQDAHVVGYALEAARGVVVVANKWDLVREGEWTQEDHERRQRWKLKFAPWISIRFVSAREGTGVDELLAEAVRIGDERQRHVDTGALNQAVRRAVAQKPPPTPSKGKRIKLLYVTQAEVNPPTFVFFLNDASMVHFSYRRYMENVLRRSFGFEGTAIKLVFRGRAVEA
ncbi:MAG TPA: ribosome biogenesis GTPase Der [Dehalococcoidia bacterium]|nr:ribosome biogenesis GTPase Der [Dehalococcoidia bacterium]